MKRNGKTPKAGAGISLRRRILTVIVLCALLPSLLIGAYCLISFTNKTKEMVEQNVLTASSVQAHNIENFFSQRMVNLRVISRLPSVQALVGEDLDRQAYGEWLDLSNEIFSIRQQEQEYLERVSLVDTDDVVVSSSDESMIGRRSHLSDEIHRRLIGGTPALSGMVAGEPGGPEAGDAWAYYIAQPVMIDGVYRGYVAMFMNTAYFQTMAADTSFFRTGAITILDGQGNIVSTGSSLLAGLKNIYEKPDSDSFLQQLRQLEESESAEGSLTFDLNGVAKLAHYNRITGTDWVVLSSISRSEFTYPIQWTLILAGLFLAVMAALVGLMARLVTRYFSRPIEGLLAVIRRVEKGDYSSRMDGTRRDELGEIAQAFNHLMDTVEENNRELRMKEERYRIVSEQSDTILLDYDILGRTLTFSSNFRDKFGYLPDLTGRFPDCLRGSDAVHEADRALFEELCGRIRDGGTDEEYQLRLRRADGTYIWCGVQMTTIFGEGGEAVRAVGRLTDIDREKKEKDRLQFRAQRDSMTGLYNKATAESRMIAFLEESAPPAGDGKDVLHALFVIDLDNFKTINDTCGHLAGDDVIGETARRLAGLFRSTDIVGRIGGDEFAVLMREVPSAEQVVQKGWEIAEVLRQEGGEQRACAVSVSVGAALYPRDGARFKELFASADHALYAVKSEGKGSFRLFDSTVEREHYTIQMEDSRPHQSVLYDDRQNLALRVFRLLYEAEDARVAVPRILEMVGRQYGVSRAYVFEDSPDGSRCSNTYEWCGEGVEPQIGQLQDVEYRSLGDYWSNFDNDGIFYCSDVAKLTQEQAGFLGDQDIHSLLQCAIVNNGRYVGFVGFDECKAQRLWTREEIETLSFIAQELSVFLVKMRIQQKLEREYDLSRNILDAQDQWTYVVDSRNYELLFINQKTQQLAPGARVGDKCYEAFFGEQGAPCVRCPMKGAVENGHCTMEIYNRHLEVWTSAAATALDWDGRSDVYLLCCTDITPYKRETAPPDETDECV